jgi:Mn2+/Fe2+ NRAMP family transporter
VFLVVLANTFNIGADIGAMGEALQLLVGGNALVYAVAFAALCVVLQIFIPYTKYSVYLKWLTPVLFTYVATDIVVHVPWGAAAKGTFIPQFEKSGEYWTTFIAILGTTISPYLFFWQASQETEEIRDHPADQPLTVAPEQAQKQFSRIRWDTCIGMFLSNIIGMFIIVAAAVTLNKSGQTTINTAGQAAEALRPLAGRLAFMFFAAGIVGTGLLAVPVLAGSAAYAVGEALHLPTGLDRKPLAARGFYAVLTLATLVGVAINFPVIQSRTHITPIRALFWSAVFNGIVAVPVMAVMMLMSRNPKVMRDFARMSPALRIMGWAATAVMAIATIGMFLTWKS